VRGEEVWGVDGEFWGFLSWEERCVRNGTGKDGCK
jgi:hypothetical protein